jgi:hypothetical protein
MLSGKATSGSMSSVVGLPNNSYKPIINTAWVRSRLGRFPVENFINSQAILYLARLPTDNLNPLLKEAFELSKSLDSQSVSNNHEAYTNKNNT